MYINKNIKSNNKMHKQLTCTYIQHSNTKQEKYRKTSANNMVKKAINELQNSYWSGKFNHLHQNASPNKSIYTQVIDLTLQICTNFLACGKTIRSTVDLADILKNNFVLGLKIKNASMVGGFVYVAIKYLSQGLNNVIVHLVSIRDIAHQSSFKRNCQYPLSNQLVLACQNLNVLILPNLLSENLSQIKVQGLILNALICLSQAIQNSQIKLTNIKFDQKQIDPQQLFYHKSLKAVKVCKLSKRNYLYKQLLASYFKYVSQSKVIPHLDICKLLIDAILIELQSINSDQNSNSKCSPSDQDTMGFLIRKCFSLILQHVNHKGFFVEDTVLSQAVKICLQTSPYCNHSKNILQIFYTLLNTQKLSLVVDTQTWMSINLQNNKKQNKSNELIESLRYACSCMHYVQQITIQQYNKMLKNNIYDNTVIKKTNQMYRSLKKNIKYLMEWDQSVFINIFQHIIGILYNPTQHIFSLCQKWNQNNYNIIEDWCVCTQIQNIIIINDRFRSIRGNYYIGYQFHNNYILITRQYIHAIHHNTNTNINTHRLPLGTKTKNQNLLKYIQIFSNVEQIAKNYDLLDKVYRYWDQLINLGANMLENCSNVQSLYKVVYIIQELLKCHQMVGLAHNLIITNNKNKQVIIINNKINKINGIYNLIITLTKLKQPQINTKGNTHTTSHNILSLTKSDLMILKKQKQRIRANIIYYICIHFIEYILTTIIPQIQPQYNNPNRTQPYPFEDIFPQFLSILPILYCDLTLQERVSICRIRNKIIQQVNYRTIIKCRYVYHRLVASLLHNYLCLTNTAEIQQQNRNQIKTNIISYLDQYIHLYHKQQTFRKSLSQTKSHPTKQNHKTVQQTQPTPTAVKSINKNNKQQQQINTINNYSKDYNDMLYIDFMQWVINYTETKNINDILVYANQIMGQWLQGLTLQEYLSNLLKSIISINNPTIVHLQLITQCTNKLLYIHSNNNKTNTNQQYSNDNDNDNDNDKTQQQNTQNQTTTIKTNIQFQIQQASAHIRQLNQIITNYTTFCIQYFRYQKSNMDKFMHTQWNNTNIVIKQHTRLCQFINIGRVGICLSNIIGICYSIGHTYHHNINNTTNTLQFLCYFKLIISQQYQSVLQLYARYAQMIFLGYIPVYEYEGKYQEIMRYVTERNKQNDMYSQYLITIIKLYMDQYNNGKDMQACKIISQNIILKHIQITKKLKHTHPHKQLLRTISTYILNYRQINQSSMQKYQQPVLPLTYSILAQNTTYTSSTTRQQIKNIFQNCSNQIQHKIFITIMESILECIVLHQQISQFRSILRLAMFYFVRARNFRGILLVLQCYQMRMKNLPSNHNINNRNQPNRKSQIQSIPSKTEKTNKNQLFYALDMLSISDSLSNILQTIFLSNFDKRNYDKFCKIVLGTNKRRTSMSFHVSFTSVMDILASSLNLCGEIGAQVFLLLGNYTCKALQCRNQSIMYKYYLQLSQPCQKHPKTNKKQLDRHLIPIFKKAQQQKHQYNKLQGYLLQEIKAIIPHSYYHAHILENLLHTIKYFSHYNQCMEGVGISEEIVLDLCVLMLDHNYLYKGMVQAMHSITITINQNDESQYLNAIYIANSKYDHFVNSYQTNHRCKIQYLLSNKFQHPLTIIYPFGQKVYILAVQNPIIVLQLDRLQFDQYIHTVDNLILNNSRLLNDKNVDPKEWWKSRDRVDRSIGKIVNQIGVILWDVCINSNNIKFLSNNEKKLWKLIYICMKSMSKDTKKIYSIISSSGINTKGISIEQLILDVNSFINAQTSHKGKTIKGQNLLLLIHPHYSIFPYQQNSYLSRERAVYRLPSIKYILQQKQKQNQMHYKIFNITNTSYLVNSGNDLPETEKNFYKIKNNFPLWRGIVGRKPTILEYLNLFQSQAFLFMGHGAGNAHLREKQFYNKLINCLILLFGCSSASMCQQKCQPNGISHSHLINGTPGLLGCLWEVTDKDTDKVTQNLFLSLGKQPQNLSRLLSNSKKKCKHQFLNGGSIVVFGLPIYVYLD